MKKKSYFLRYSCRIHSCIHHEFLVSTNDRNVPRTLHRTKQKSERVGTWCEVLNYTLFTRDDDEYNNNILSITIHFEILRVSIISHTYAYKSYGTLKSILLLALLFT